MVQKVCSFRGCPLGSFVILQRLTELPGLLPDLFAQQLGVAEQLCCPRGLPTCYPYTQCHQLLNQGTFCTQSPHHEEACFVRHASPSNRSRVVGTGAGSLLHLRSLPCAAGSCAAMPAVWLLGPSLSMCAPLSQSQCGLIETPQRTSMFLHPADDAQEHSVAQDAPASLFILQRLNYIPSRCIC